MSTYALKEWVLEADSVFSHFLYEYSRRYFAWLCKWIFKISIVSQCFWHSCPFINRFLKMVILREFSQWSTNTSASWHTRSWWFSSRPKMDGSWCPSSRRGTSPSGRCHCHRQSMATVSLCCSSKRCIMSSWLVALLCIIGNDYAKPIIS